MPVTSFAINLSVVEVPLGDKRQDSDVGASSARFSFLPVPVLDTSLLTQKVGI